MADIRCEKCNKRFQTEEALEHHNQMKHSAAQEKKTSQDMMPLIKVSLVVVAVAALVVFGLYFIPGSSFDGNVVAAGELQDNEELLKVNLRNHNNLALHIHPFLEIEILGEKQAIPNNVGLAGPNMKVIHTHDSTGRLHIETPYPATLYLKDFFTVWGRPFNQTCIFDYCEDENHTLTVTANGGPVEDKENLPFEDGQRIRIIYEEKKS
jgi:hypothetical protein